ncbi:MAG: hypothetical protein IRZ21_12010 [Thermoleophilaceae bacterium]|nr:hypothetical protein [Thermoleophilaceae bacterium]
MSNASDAAARSGLSPSDAQTSVDARAAASSGSSAGAGAAPGLESVPIQFQFTGSFFDLADFLHRLKRFVHLRGDQVVVHGRLMTVDRIALTTPQDSSRRITAQISATAYLSPKSEGVTAGATPSGPAPGTPAPSGTQTASSSTPPTAVVTR